MPKIIDHEGTRDAIADAFVRVVAARGVATVTMREIAREAGISQTLPLYYFDSREALVEFAFARQTQLSVEDLLEVTRSGGSAKDRIRATVNWLVKRASTNQAKWRMIIAMIVENRENSRINDLDRECYNKYLEELELLFDAYRLETGIELKPRAEALMLITATDGLSLATASLGATVQMLMVPQLNELLLERFGLSTDQDSLTFAA
jgi:AcrR family transcriptional regulator